MFEIKSSLLNATRQLWIEHDADAGGSSDCIVFLDAELYRSRVKASERVREAAMAAGRAAPTCVYVSAPDAEARHHDFTCSEVYADFVSNELLPWIEDTAAHHERYFICGLSLSGLQASFMTLRYPDRFAGALCQSPSAWWNDEWLTESLDTFAAGPHANRFWISVGDKEVQEGMVHPPTGLMQKVSQLDSCRRFAAKLSERGGDVHFAQLEGGHDPGSWGADLPAALSWLLRSNESGL